MNCAQIKTELIGYLDGKCGPVERSRIQGHLAGCAACQTIVQQFRAVSSALDELPNVVPSPAFDAAVRTRIATEPQRAQFWAWLVPSPQMALAITALAMISVWLGSQGPARRVDTAVIAQGSEADFSMIQDLPVLEDYDVLADFDALSELPGEQAAARSNR